MPAIGGRRLQQLTADDLDALWTPEQLGALLHHVAEDRSYARLLVFATSGERRGEVAGLAHDDLDLDAGTVRIRWTPRRRRHQGHVESRAKSDAGERVMALGPATVDALRAHLARQNEERLYAGPAWHPRAADCRGNHRDDVVFTWPDGSLIHPERFSRWFPRHTEAAGLPRIRLHDVRHIYATVGSCTQPVGTRSRRLPTLGHASGFTIDTYAHVLTAADADTAFTLARLILGRSA